MPRLTVRKVRIIRMLWNAVPLQSQIHQRITVQSQVHQSSRVVGACMQLTGMIKSLQQFFLTYLASSGFNEKKTC
jgi:hypothetical protein